MKQFGVIAFALLGVCVLAVAQKRDSAKEFTAAEQSFNDALLRADWKAIEELYADGLIFTNADGAVSHKSDDVATLKSGSVRFESIEMSDVRVQDLGNMGVVTGNLVEKGKYKTSDLGGTYRYTDVWAKLNGRWQLVAGQETRYTPAK